MTRKPLFAAVVVLSLFIAGTASANRRSFGASTSRYTSNGKFGLGIELGAPAGLNGKLFLSPNTALNFGVGWLYDNYYRDGDGVHLYLDHLWHPFSISDNPTFKLPFYVGVGGAFWSFHDRRKDPRYEDRYSALGVRVPVGIAFDFNSIPLDVFVQLTFVFNIYFNDYRDRYGPNILGSVGARYWFD